MAAHVKTALEQIVVDAFHYDHLLPAFDISCWTDDLDLTDYIDLRDVVKSYASYPDNHRRDVVKTAARFLLDKYTDEWLNLGQPSTREEWRNAKYGVK